MEIKMTKLELEKLQYNLDTIAKGIRTWNAAQRIAYDQATKVIKRKLSTVAEPIPDNT